ncbi:histidine--tRNA ligase [Ureaplasma canigenitalium]|uniref:histidine--tRNA ligase n=1 Tax=Ureaplasma canigenitalium TaxID=42092 RepID=UPI0004E0E754|nr:histidine--tRNA ligase [Ureaplasma canigenitalium]
MSNSYIKPRGTLDWYMNDIFQLKKLEDILLKTGELFGFDLIKTPVFEHTELFTRSSGETSDIVNKEMYTFLDKGDRSLSLRPEGTAGVLRAVIENKLLLKTSYPLKTMYFEPCFRYERPQKGRLRMFHQFGVEYLNVNSIYMDFEVLALANSILSKLKINDYVLEINYISTKEKRTLWIKDLQTYFNGIKDQLSTLNQERINSNVLRILDDKDIETSLISNAPNINDYLDENEKTEFNTFLNLLDENGIKYKVNKNLVRGLDYYEGVVFEFISTSNLLIGQSTLIGGGRYNSLIKELGGPDAIGVGFGLGIERIIVLLKEKTEWNNLEKPFDYVIGALEPKFIEPALGLCLRLRNNGKRVNINLQSFKMSNIFKMADSYKAKYTIIFASKEFSENSVIIKDNLTKEQKIVNIDEIN